MIKTDAAIICFLDERMITCKQRGGTRNWLCPSQCKAEKLFWKEIIANELYQRFSSEATTTLLFQRKLYQIADLIRSSETPSKISITIEGKIICKNSISNQPHRTFYFSTRKLNLLDPLMKELRVFIIDESNKNIADIIKNIFEKNIALDFVYKTNWVSLEVMAAKVHFDLN